MRQVFRSQRLENVEAAADLMRKQGIEVKIANGRSFRGHRRGNFSYDLRKASDPDTLPTLWIVNADDQPHARRILRELGLLESTRETGTEALPNDRFEFSPGSGAAKPGIRRWRIGLVVLIAIVIALIVFLPRRKPAPTPATTPATTPHAAPALVPETITETDSFRMDVPKALAARLLQIAAERSGANALCASIDGRDPAPEVIRQASAAGTTVLPASACGDAKAPKIAIENYQTDGSGGGEILLRINAEETPFIAQREGRTWKVQPKP